MALMNCPECNKEMSDTLKKCPHCGFVIKKKKLKNKNNNYNKGSNLKEKLSILYKKTIKNKFFWIICGVLVIAIILLTLYLSSIQISRALKMMEYLEAEDYKCREASYFGNNYSWLEKGYVCILEEDNYIKKFIIQYDDDLFDRLQEINAHATFIYSDKDYYFELGDYYPVARLGYYNLHTNTLYKKYDKFPSIDFMIDGKKVEYDECNAIFDDPSSIFYEYDAVKECEVFNRHYEKYAELVKEALDEMDDLYDEVNQEIEREEW